MRRLLLPTLPLLVCLLLSQAALAQPYEGLSVAEIQALPGFHASDHGPSSARVSAEPDAVAAFDWIGWVSYRGNDGQLIYVCFDKSGAGVSSICASPFDEDIPAWVAPALSYLYDCGLLSDGCMMEDFTWAAVEKGFDPRAGLKEIQ